MKKISVFMASPGDLSAEHRQFRETIHQLNVGFGNGAGILKDLRKDILKQSSNKK